MVRFWMLAAWPALAWAAPPPEWHGFVPLPPETRDCNSPYKCLDKDFQLRAATTIQTVEFNKKKITETIYFTKGNVFVACHKETWPDGKPPILVMVVEGWHCAEEQ